MEIPFVDLGAQYASIKNEVDRALHKVLGATTFVGGEEVALFESNFASYCGVKHAVGVANGTDALRLALKALDIGPGDEVITVAHTFIATAAAITMAGARPVFVDIDPDTYTIDVSQIESAITPQTKAIIPVHIYGQPADMGRILEIAQKRSLYVIEDAAQAHGAEYNGKRVGSVGDIGCFSFYPGKNLGAYGDGGAITTNNDQIAERIMLLRDHGRISKYEHAVVGFNSRLDTVQAAVLNVKLRHLDKWNYQRQRAATWYNAMLSQMGIRTPPCRAGSTHVYHLYVIEMENREILQSRLKAAGISSGVHYPIPLHLQPALARLGYGTGDFPHSERAAQRIISLPIFPELTREQKHHVINTIKVGEICAASARRQPRLSFMAENTERASGRIR
jgi:dTDP-4-amino-4,6-dideoxygalactose transaminase